jgi:hypothetical protein
MMTGAEAGKGVDGTDDVIKLKLLLVISGGLISKKLLIVIHPPDPLS